MANPMLDASFRMLKMVAGLQVAGLRVSRSQVSGLTSRRSQVSQVSGLQVSGRRSQVTGLRSQVSGHRSQVTGLRSGHRSQIIEVGR